MGSGKILQKISFLRCFFILDLDRDPYLNSFTQSGPGNIMATTSWFRCDPTRKFGKESFAKNYVQQRIEKDNARRRLIMQEVEAEKKRKLEETEKTKDKKMLKAKPF